MKPGDGERTAGSLRKINDFPFYGARYYGDYGLREFMGGALNGPEDVAPFFEGLLSRLGKPAKLTFPPGPPPRFGCSAFYCRSSDGRPLAGKNLDWQRAPVLLLKTRPAGAYASLTLVNLDFCDLFGLGSFEHSLLLSPYVPLDGMNEKGLVVSMLSVEGGASYPRERGKPAVGDFNIIRCILDSCATVEEGITLFRRYNLIQSSPLPLHYLLADSRESAVVEFFGGAMHVRIGEDRTYLTNFLTLDPAAREKGMGECPRYGELMRSLERGFPVEREEAERILRRVSRFREDFRPPSTIWSVIYRPDEGAMGIKVGENTPWYRATLRGDRP